MTTATTAPDDTILGPLATLLPDLEAVYTDIHAHPELSTQETRTAGIAAERLSAAGFQVTTGVGKTGVVGLLRRGKGPTVMLRADMDALPVAEATGLPGDGHRPRGQLGTGDARLRPRHARHVAHRPPCSPRRALGSSVSRFATRLLAGLALTARQPSHTAGY